MARANRAKLNSINKFAYLQKTNLFNTIKDQFKFLRMTPTPAPEEKINETISPTLKHYALDFIYFIWDILKTLVIIGSIVIFIRVYLVQPFIIEGQSMEPNFHQHSYMLVEKISYRLHSPQRGDVIVFNYPKDPRTKFIKRIIGLPGEQIQVDKGIITIINSKNPNGTQLKESYLKNISTSGEINKKLEKDEYYVLGDNRDNSSDSRTWGVLPKNNIVGKTWLILFPLSQLGIFKTPTFPDLSELSQQLKLAFQQIHETFVPLFQEA